MSNDSIKHKLKNITEENTHLLDYVYDIECRLLKAEQYSRQESIEVMGIPDNIAHKDLEQSVLKIFNTIGGNNISACDIAACHRLPKKSGSKFPN